MKDKADVLYTKGCDLVDAHAPESELIDYPLTDEEQKEIDKAVSQAKQADVAIVVLGGGSARAEKTNPAAVSTYPVVNSIY